MCDTAGSAPPVPVATVSEETEPRLTIPLEPVDSIVITTLIDNVTDMLAVNTGPARRPFIGDARRAESAVFEEGWTLRGLVAEHGFAALITVTAGDSTHRLLFDAGLSPDGLVSNMRALGGPPGAVRGDEDGGRQPLEFGADLGDQRLEQRPAEVEAAHDGVYLADARELARVPGDVDDAGVPAAGQHDQALAPHVHDQRLVVEHQRVRLPPAAAQRLLRREAGLEP